MTDLGNVPRQTPAAPRDRRALARRALACELTGELDRAMKLIRCLQRRGPDQPVPDPGDRGRRTA